MSLKSNSVNCTHNLKCTHKVFHKSWPIHFKGMINKLLTYSHIHVHVLYVRMTSLEFFLNTKYVTVSVVTFVRCHKFINIIYSNKWNLLAILIKHHQLFPRYLYSVFLQTLAWWIIQVLLVVCIAVVQFKVYLYRLTLL